MIKHNQALNYLSSLPSDERLYVKLLRPRSDTNILNRNNFIMLYAAAFAAAKYENPSMKNYRGGQETATGGYVDKVVTTYLTVRTNMSISSMVRSPYAYLRPSEMEYGTRVSDRQSKGAITATTVTESTNGERDMPSLRLPRRPSEQSSPRQTTPASNA
jgi:hypothetical protein